MPHFQVVNILETRAHSIELSKNRYYDLLYAFHVKRNNYRKGETCLWNVFSVWRFWVGGGGGTVGWVLDLWSLVAGLTR